MGGGRGRVFRDKVEQPAGQQGQGRAARRGDRGMWQPVSLLSTLKFKEWHPVVPDNTDIFMFCWFCFIFVFFFFKATALFSCFTWTGILCCKTFTSSGLSQSRQIVRYRGLGALKTEKSDFKGRETKGAKLISKWRTELCCPHWKPASPQAWCGKHLSADYGVGTRGLEGLGVRAAARLEVHLPPGATPSGLPLGTIELCA